MLTKIQTYPIDVSKTVYQKALLSGQQGKIEIPPIHFFSAASYRGLGVSMARSAIINMIFFSYFEKFKKSINVL